MGSGAFGGGAFFLSGIFNSGGRILTSLRSAMGMGRRIRFRIFGASAFSAEAGSVRGCCPLG
jgi:hypothetical protein